MNPRLMFLVHRVPYPPNKGDKIRSFHLLQYLSVRYRVSLGAFFDTPEDAKHAEALQRFCEEVFLVPLVGRKARVRSVRGFLQKKALTLPYYRDASLERWIQAKLEDEGVERILIFSSSMAQYVMGKRWADRRRVIDFVDVDSDKWRQYAPTRRWPMNWVYRREADKLLAFEREVMAEFDSGFFVSPQEAALFRQLAPESADKVLYVNNGVDLGYYASDRPSSSPYEASEQVVVFVGAMDYWPNIDAVDWFAREVLPRIQAKVAAVQFYIVGSNPAARVRALSNLDGVKVTGGVPDVRPYVRHAQAVVVPLRIARGVQNKVLEAMAMAKPTVVSAAALEGIDAQAGRDVLLGTGEKDFAEIVVGILNGQINGDAIGQAARRLVKARYDWQSNLATVSDLLKPGTTERPIEVAANAL